MPKLIRDWKEEKLDPWNDILARWMMLLGIVDHRNGVLYEGIYKELEEIAMKDEVLKSAFQGWEQLSATEEEVDAYEARLKRVLDEEAMIIEAELREKEAREQGLEEGMEKGIEQGMEKGIEKGVKQTAKKMLQKNLPHDLIKEVTGLDEEEIDRLQED